jgi:hypothetical protein
VGKKVRGLKYPGPIRIGFFNPTKRETSYGNSAAGNLTRVLRIFLSRAWDNMLTRLICSRVTGGDEISPPRCDAQQDDSNEIVRGLYGLQLPPR